MCVKIKRLWQILNDTGSGQDRTGSGRPRVTTSTQDRYNRELHLQQRVRNRIPQRRLWSTRPYV